MISFLQFRENCRVCSLQRAGKVFHFKVSLTCRMREWASSCMQSSCDSFVLGKFCSHSCAQSLREGGERHYDNGKLKFPPEFSHMPTRSHLNDSKFSSKSFSLFFLFLNSYIKFTKLIFKHFIFFTVYNFDIIFFSFTFVSIVCFVSINFGIATKNISSFRPLLIFVVVVNP